MSSASGQFSKEINLNLSLSSHKNYWKGLKLPPPSKDFGVEGRPEKKLMQESELGKKKLQLPFNDGFAT